MLVPPRFDWISMTGSAVSTENAFSMSRFSLTKGGTLTKGELYSISWDANQESPDVSCYSEKRLG